MRASPSQASTLDSFITRLLVVTKQLLQGLDQWSQGMLSEEDVSGGVDLRCSRRRH